MLAIPNMKMPLCCVECHWYYECYDEHCTLGKFLLRKYPTDVSKEPYILDTQRHPKCPLIEIVECKDCKHYQREECRLDPFWEKDTEPTDFCSKGERRADD